MKNLPTALTCSVLAFGQISSRGASQTASFIAKVANESRQHLQASVSLGLKATGIFDDLYDAFEENQEQGWDGGSAIPIQQDTYFNAYRFLESLPPGFQAPSIGVEPDGHLTVEWYKGPRHTISVSVGPNGFLYFSALIGLRKVNGSAPFFGDAPKIILDLVAQVYAA